MIRTLCAKQQVIDLAWRARAIGKDLSGCRFGEVGSTLALGRYVPLDNPGLSLYLLDRPFGKLRGQVLVGNNLRWKVIFNGLNRCIHGLPHCAGGPPSKEPYEPRPLPDGIAI